jgi:hypothetical protein
MRAILTGLRLSKEGYSSSRCKHTLWAFLIVLGMGCSASSTVVPQADGDSQPVHAESPTDTDRVQGGDNEVKATITDVNEVDGPVRKETLVGYYAWWMKGAWMDLDLEVYDRIVFFTTRPGSDGRIQTRNGWPHAWVSFLGRSDSLGIPVVPALALMEADSIKTLFSSKEAVNNLIETALMLVEESRGAGVHLDIELFEAVVDSVRDGFYHFTDSLAIRMAQEWPEATLSMFAPAFDYDGLYDLERIHDGYSQIMVQGYDLHWQTGPSAGPVATLKGWNGANWEDVLIRYKKAGISSDRIIMTVPYYGYEWPVETSKPGAATRGEARIITYALIDSLILPQYQISIDERVTEFGASRDSVSGSPYYIFSDSSGYWQGWFEDETSLRTKYTFVQENGLRGIATFPMGYDKGILDAQLKAHFGRRLPRVKN